MLFQRINRSSPEKVFVVAYNSYSTAAITNGQGVNWDFITDIDGVGVTIPLARAARVVQSVLCWNPPLLCLMPVSEWRTRSGLHGRGACADIERLVMHQLARGVEHRQERARDVLDVHERPPLRAAEDRLSGFLEANKGGLSGSPALQSNTSRRVGIREPGDSTAPGKSGSLFAVMALGRKPSGEMVAMVLP